MSWSYISFKVSSHYVCKLRLEDSLDDSVLTFTETMDFEYISLAGWRLRTSVHQFCDTVNSVTEDSGYYKQNMFGSVVFVFVF